MNLLPILQSKAIEENSAFYCGICPDKGRCCKRFRLFAKDGNEITFWKDEGEEKVRAWLSGRGYPFVPIEICEEFRAEDGRIYATWWFGCPLLDERGLCTKYEQRPEICRRFQPGSSALCVFGGPPFRTE